MCERSYCSFCVVLVRWVVLFIRMCMSCSSSVLSWKGGICGQNVCGCEYILLYIPLCFMYRRGCGGWGNAVLTIRRLLDSICTNAGRVCMHLSTEHSSYVTKIADMSNSLHVGTGKWSGVDASFPFTHSLKLARNRQLFLELFYTPCT